MDRVRTSINSLLEQAARIVRSQKEAAGTFEPTESYKRRQIKELIEFANANSLWISLSDLNIEFLSKGGENEVYEVFDAVPNNVLYGIDGDLYFIDTQIRLRS